MASKKIRIMTDSVSDLPPALLEKWDIAVVPCFVNYEGESYADDGVELDRAHFYQSIAAMKEFPTTAAPPPGLAERMMHEAIAGYDHLISINVSGNLSATINNVRIAAQSLPNDKVTVLDSESVSMGIGWQVLIAAEVAAATGDVAAVVDAVGRVRKHHKLFAIIATMEYLRRSGRVSKVMASIGTILQIKPIVTIEAEGEVEAAHRVRTMKKAKAKLEELARSQSPLDRLVIIHTQDEAGAREFQAQLGDFAPQDTLIAEVGPTLGTHIGIGSLGVVTLNTAWKQ